MNIRNWFKRVPRSDAAAIFALALAPFVVHWQVTLGLRAFADGDIARLFIPFGAEFARALNEGRLPMWTTLIQAGLPLFAEGHVAALYPLNHLLFRLLPPYLAVSYSILFHQAWAGVGMFLFARNLSLRASSALLAAIVFSWGGFFTAHLQHVTLLATAAWLPWLALAQIQFQRAQTRAAQLRWFVFAVACIALEFVSGFPQIALLNFSVYLFFALGTPFVWGDSAASRWRAAVNFTLVSLAALGLGAGIAAAQLLPAQELLSLSVRASELGAEFTTSFSLDPHALSQFLFPFAHLGAPDVLNQEYWAYLGIAPFALFIAAPILRRDRATIFFFLVALMALALALGNTNPAYYLLDYIPLFNRFRVPARFLLPFTFFAAMLAAHAMNALLQRWSAARPHAAFALLALGATLLDLALFQIPFLNTLNAHLPPAEILDTPPVFRAMTDASARFYTNVYTPNLRPNRPMMLDRTSAQVYSPLTLQRFADYEHNLSPAMANLLGMRYVVQHSGELAPEYADQNWNPGLDFFQGEFTLSSLSVMRVEIVSYTDDTESLDNGVRAGEIILKSTDQSPVVLPIRLGTETADWAYAVLNTAHSQPRDAQRFPAFLPSTREFDGFKYTARFDFPAPLTLTSIQARATLPRGKWFIESITFYDSTNQPHSLATWLNRAETRVVFKSHTATLYESQSVLPRALVFHRAEVLSDEKTLARLKEPGFTADGVLLLNDGTPIAHDDAPRGTAEIADYRAERVMVRVESPRSGYSFLADTWYPGWVAYVDGKPAPIYRADYIFRAVPIDAGAHEVVFEFRPQSFYTGALISTASLAITFVLLFLSWKTNA